MALFRMSDDGFFAPGIEAAEIGLAPKGGLHCAPVLVHLANPKAKQSLCRNVPDS